MKHPSLKIIVLLLFASSITCNNEIPNGKKNSDIDFRKLEKPYRMNKLNILWLKAQHRLTVPKLKSLYSDLMIQDKEELTLKRLKSDGGDKEGMREAEIRRKLTNIMSVYGLREHFDDDAPPRHKEYAAYNSAIDDHINKSIFKDKKLNMLWNKAETSGFTSEELAALKEEFTHHQDKIDQYYEILTDIDQADDKYKNHLNEDELEKFHEINEESSQISKEFRDKSNLVREKHQGIKDSYDKLQRITARGPNNKEFIEPKVQGLWRMAVAANFSIDELVSLKVELHHYESRLLKLRHLHADHVSNREKHTKNAAAGDKIHHFEEQEQMIKKHSRKVEKMHADLEGRILERHTEL